MDNNMTFTPQQLSDTSTNASTAGTSVAPKFDPNASTMPRTLPTQTSPSYNPYTSYSNNIRSYASRDSCIVNHYACDLYYYYGYY